MSERHELVYRQGELSVEELRDEVERLWRGLRTDAAAREELAAAGVDVAELDTEAATPPIQIASRGAGFGIVEILVIAAGVVARDLWREVLLPRIKERYGVDAVRDAPDDGAEDG